MNNWLNYNHLYYFWMVAKEGGIASAAQKLRLSPSTISIQIARLEEISGQQLFLRSHRQMNLTDMGQQVFLIANEIFALGQRLETLLEQGSNQNRYSVGIAIAMPKLLVGHLLPLSIFQQFGTQLLCLEDQVDQLVSALLKGEVDVLLSDEPPSSLSMVQVYSHLLGQTSISVFASSQVLHKHGYVDFQDVFKLPLILPTAQGILRHRLEQLFFDSQLKPNIVIECQDPTQIKIYGQHHVGAFFAPTCLAHEISIQYQVEHLGNLDIYSELYLISREKRIKDPMAVAIMQNAQKWYQKVNLKQQLKFE